MNKKLISMLLAVLMVVSLFAGMTTSAYAEEVTDATLFKEYTMRQGDTVLKLCTSRGLNYYTCKNAIMKMNGFSSDSDFRFIPVGKVIYLPVSNDAAVKIATVGTTIQSGTQPFNPTPTAAPKPTATSSPAAKGDAQAYYLVPHTMQKGETIYSVCQALYSKYNAAQIQKINNLSSVNNVKAGQTILFPVESKPAVGVSCYVVMKHTVAAGETAYTICNNNGISLNGNLKLLQALNNKDNLNYITAGSAFYVPVATVIAYPAGVSGSTATGTGTAATTTSGTGTASGTSASGTTASGTASNVRTYPLTANSANGGYISFYVGSKQVYGAAAGEIVTVVTTPDNGYAVESLDVIYADGSASPKLTGNSFVMPTCAVTANVSFIKGFELSIDCKYTNGIKLMVNGLNVSSAVQGSKVVVASNNPALAIDGKIELYNATTGKFWKSIDPSMSFDMPGYQIRVKANMKTVKTYTFIRNVVSNIKDTPDKWTLAPEQGSFVLQVNGSTISKAAEGTKVTVLASPTVGYTVGSVRAFEYDVKNGKEGGELNIIDGNSFIMPAKEAKVGVEFVPTSSKIVIEPSSYGSAVAKVGSTEVSFAKTKQEVTIEETAEAGYTAAKPLVYSMVDDTMIEVKESGSGKYTFIMPGEGAKIVPQFKGAEKKLTIKFVKEDGTAITTSGCEVLVNQEKIPDAGKTILSGTQLFLSERANVGYDIVKYIVEVGGKYSSELSDAANNNSMFTMPADETVVKVVLKPAAIKLPKQFLTNYSVNWFNPDNLNQGADTANVGEKAVFYVMGNNGFNIEKDLKKIVVTNAGNNEPIGTVEVDPLTVTSFSGYTLKQVTFTGDKSAYENGLLIFEISNMPAENVKIDVTVEKQPVIISLSSAFTVDDGSGTPLGVDKVENWIRVSNGSTYDESLKKDFTRKVNSGEQTKVSIDTKFAPDYELASIIYECENDAAKVQHYVEAKNGVATFTMPDDSIKFVSAVVKNCTVKTSTFVKEFTNVRKLIFVDSTDQIIERSSYRVGEDVWFRLDLKNNAVLPEMNKDDFKVVDADTNAAKTLTYQGNGYYSFTLDTKNVKLIIRAARDVFDITPAKFAATDLDWTAYAHQIVIATGKTGWTYGDSFSGFEAYNADTVKITLNGEKAKADITSVVVTDSLGNAVKVTQKDNTFSFTMPADDVNIVLR